MFVAHFQFHFDIAINLNFAVEPSKRMCTADFEEVYNDLYNLEAMPKETHKLFLKIDRIILSKVVDTPDKYEAKMKRFVRANKDEHEDIYNRLTRLASLAVCFDFLAETAPELHVLTLQTYSDAVVDYDDAHTAMETGSKVRTKKRITSNKNPLDENKSPLDENKSPSDEIKSPLDEIKSPSGKNKIRSEKIKNPSDEDKSPSKEIKNISNEIKSPSDKIKDRFSAATSYFVDENQHVKFVTGQKPYVDRTLRSRVKDDEHEVIIKPFLNSNGIDLRQTVLEEFTSRKAGRVEAINDENKQKDIIFNDQLKKDIRAHNKANPGNKRIFSEEKRKTPLVHLKDVPVNFSKQSFVYTTNPHMSFNEVLQVIIDLHGITQ